MNEKRKTFPKIKSLFYPAAYYGVPPIIEKENAYEFL